MGTLKIKYVLLSVIMLVLVFLSQPVLAVICADHNCISEFEEIPADVITQIKNNYRIFYGHTSHGGQIVTGMDMIKAENGLFDFNNGSGTLQMHEISDDLGAGGDISWANITRGYLDNPSYDFNVVIWSWCGGAGYTSVAGINMYLNTYALLEAEYPDVTFVYMTGHLNGTGETDTIFRSNSLIRNFCADNDKVLFDFADIESYDPDGVYFIDETDACNWCATWCQTHSCPTCDACAHSHCFNCYLKGKGFWWMMARLTGWTPVLAADEDEAVVPDAFYLGQNFPNPFNPGTTIEYRLNSNSGVNIIVYNLLGELVTVLEDANKLAGTHRVVWNGTDSDDQLVPSGIYFYLLRTDTYTESKKMVLQK
ncbi:MAG: T9SS type A sorting domain-containing protein [candidate division Zixibacteria bacterium]|nr:T9SS type A sorting domain-containing protein [candidate division Zixibacteria bacterium]